MKNFVINHGKHFCQKTIPLSNQMQCKTIIKYFNKISKIIVNKEIIINIQLIKTKIKEKK